MSEAPVFAKKLSLDDAHRIEEVKVPDDVRADPNWFDPELKLHGSRVLVKLVFFSVEDDTSKIIRPNDASNNRDTRAGCVLAVGTGPVDKDGAVLPLPLKPGDYVLFSKNTGMNVSHLAMRDSKTFIIGYHEILAQIPTEKARKLSANHRENEKLFAQVGKSIAPLAGAPVGRGGSSDLNFLGGED